MTSRNSHRKTLIMAAFALLVMGLPMLSTPASAPQGTVVFEYAVKFICGAPPPGILAPGRYFTAINVHNPQNQTASFRKKVAVALPKQQPGPVSQFVPAALGPDQAFEIDCADILQISGQPNAPFLKGFVVIQSPVELDIVAVYTAAGAGGLVSTLHTERVPPRRVTLP